MERRLSQVLYGVVGCPFTQQTARLVLLASMSQRPSTAFQDQGDTAMRHSPFVRFRQSIHGNASGTHSRETHSASLSCLRSSVADLSIDLNTTESSHILCSRYRSVSRPSKIISLHQDLHPPNTHLPDRSRCNHPPSRWNASFSCLKQCQ